MRPSNQRAEHVEAESSNSAQTRTRTYAQMRESALPERRQKWRSRAGTC